jgi:Uncharacterised nucleotidyltransferase
MAPPPHRERNLALLGEAVGLVEAADAAGVVARLLGGLAVLQHDPALRERGGTRPVNDIDLIVGAGANRPMAELLSSRGYRAEERFNALNGHRRMLFHGERADVDVLVGTFEMCHRIEMESRFALDAPTLTVTDLLVTKLQIVKLNEKDLGDIVDVLAGHELGRGHGDWIDVDRLDELTRGDWGLWRTVAGTLDTVVSSDPRPLVAERARTLRTALDETPKSRRWKLRARVGDRVPWYVLPDEVQQ